MTEDEMVGWHHQFNGHEFEQTLGKVKDREAWCTPVHGVTKSEIQLSDSRRRRIAATTESPYQLDFAPNGHNNLGMICKGYHLPCLLGMIKPVMN